MKSKTLTLFAALLMGGVGSIYAQWTEPELPSTASELVSGHTYLIRNADNGQYLTNGSSWYTWATTLVMLEKTDEVTLIEFTPVESTDDNEVEYWTLQNTYNDKYVYISDILDENGADKNGGTINASLPGAGLLHVDGSANNQFVISSSGNLTYRISVYPGDETYGANTGYIGYNSNDEYSSAVYIFLDADDANNHCDWEFIDMATYSARVDLYNALISAQEKGVTSDEASAVYNNESATVDEIEAAITTLAKAKADKVLAGASTDDPVDGTSLIGNADFTDGTLSPWENTNGVLVYSGDTFPNSDCNVEELNDYESFTCAFAGWVSSSTSLGDEDLHQTISYLPAGLYTISLSIVAQHGTDMPEGVYFYAGNAEVECQHDASLWASCVDAGTNNQLIMHPTITLNHQGGALTIGIRLESTNCNWVYGSKFTLTYYGESDVSEAYISLQTAITNAKVYLDTDSYTYSAAVNEKLEAAVSTAEGVLATVTTDAVSTQAEEDLQAVVSIASADITAYGQCSSYLDGILSDMEAYEAYDNISGALSDLYYEVKEIYDSRNITAEQIASYIDAYDALITDLLTDAMASASEDNPLDVTRLYLVNADFSEGSDPWINDNGIIPRGTGTYPNGDCNLWEENDNESFTTVFAGWVSSSGSLGDDKTYQKVSLPSGTYMLTCSMVAQHGTDLPSGVYLFSEAAGVTTKTLCTHDETYWNSLIDAKAEEGTTPNQLMMHPEHTFFATGDETSVGVMLESTNCNWVYGSKFKLYYEGEDIEALYQSLQQLIEEALVKDDEAGFIAEIDALIMDAIDEAEDSATDDAQAILNSLQALHAAIEAASAALEAYEELVTAYTIYTDYLLGDMDISDDYMELIDEIGACIDDDEFESQAQIEGYTESLKLGYTAEVQAPVLDTASEDEPGDITAAIINANFEGIGELGNTIFWNVDRDGGTEGSNETGDVTSYEFYNNNGFSIWQTIYGLAEGYYRVRVQGYYRAGSNADNADSLAVDPTYGQNVVLMANKVAVPICNVLDGALAEDPGYDGMTSVEYNGETVYVPNTMSSFGNYVTDHPDAYWTQADAGLAEDGTLTVGLHKNAYISSDWTIWNGFELYYLGTDVPTGIESVADNGEALAGAPSSVQYYSVDGTRLPRLMPGINIVKTTAADGTVNVQKVLVK